MVSYAYCAGDITTFKYFHWQQVDITRNAFSIEVYRGGDVVASMKFPTKYAAIYDTSAQSWRDR